jgi:hypothetical protein
MQLEEHLVEAVFEMVELAQMIQAQLVAHWGTTHASGLGFQGVEVRRRQRDENGRWCSLSQKSFLDVLSSVRKRIEYKIFGTTLARDLRRHMADITACRPDVLRPTRCYTTTYADDLNRHLQTANWAPNRGLSRRACGVQGQLSARSAATSLALVGTRTFGIVARRS